MSGGQTEDMETATADALVQSDLQFVRKQETLK